MAKGEKSKLLWQNSTYRAKNLEARRYHYKTLSRRYRGKGNPMWGRKRKISEGNKGHKARSGPDSHLWKDGRSKDKKYINWLKRLHHKRKKISFGSHTLLEWENLKARYNFSCVRCQRSEPEIKLTEDHIVPLSRGGSDNIENIQPLCRVCNSRKHVKIINYRFSAEERLVQYTKIAIMILVALYLFAKVERVIWLLESCAASW